MQSHKHSLYFIAIIPSSSAREELQRYKFIFKDEYGSKASLNSPPHITLHMPFRFPPKKEGKLLYHLGKVVEGIQPLEVKLDGFGAFGPRVIYVNVVSNPALNEVQQKVVETCRKDLKLMNANYRKQAFHPHITLAFRDLKKPAFAEAWARFKEEDYKASFMVNEILLMQHDGKMWQTHTRFSFTQEL